MPHVDAFAQLARFYDPLMEHVDYDRWHGILSRLGEWLGHPRFLDAGCGTGTLLQRLRAVGWDATGYDNSVAMLREARRRHGDLSLVAADLRALPFEPRRDGHFGLVTCLFDSLNFLLDEDEVRMTIEEWHEALTPDGLLYFDIVTERMLTDHFDGQDWTENHGPFQSRWSSHYDKRTKISETRVRINTQSESLIQERVYSLECIESLLEDAGFHVLWHVDSHNGRPPSARTTRIDLYAAKIPTHERFHHLKKIKAQLLEIYQEK